MAIRITGGQWRGRLIRVPRGGLRPTQDRVRQAVFSTLAGRIAGARVLDLCAGTGAYGLEALSRGAARATWVEADRRVAAALRDTVASLAGSPEPGAAPAEAGRARVVAADVRRFLAGPDAGAPYDVVFADPPYDADGAWSRIILSGLSARSIFAPGGILVLEQTSRAPAAGGPGWRTASIRRYGETRITYIEPDPGGEGDA